ncbi:MAG: GHKL domain-containing protein, partial [Proteobacteria bacterium]
QLFQNLIANALKFRSSDPPMIDIAAQSDGESWIYSVKDNGLGFDPEFRESIFEVYKQLETNQKDQGTGLGLASCRRVVEMHGGSIWAESKLGVGSTFFFKLPKIQPQ